MKSNLYHINEKFEKIFAAIDEAEGVVGHEAMVELGKLDTRVDETFNECCREIRNEEARIAAITAEQENLANAKRIANRKVAGVRKYLCTYLEIQNMKRLDTKLFKVLRCKNSVPTIEPEFTLEGIEDGLINCDLTSVPLIDIPPHLLTLCTKKLNKTKAKMMFKTNGNKAPEGVIVRQDYHLRIK